MKGKALRRALETKDITRVGASIPLIEDCTEFITPEIAQEMLTRNRNNRPVNWNKVEEYSKIMAKGEWKLHAQGIILDGNGNIITGQTRLWAVVYSGRGVYFRVSRGTPKDTANLIDRGRPQSARDLATRQTEKKHSPTEASMARCIAVLRGVSKPTIDQIAAILVEKQGYIATALKESAGTKKTKSVIMVLAAMCEAESDRSIQDLSKRASYYAEKLEDRLKPHSAEECWNKGTAFGMALEQARKVIA